MSNMSTLWFVPLAVLRRRIFQGALVLIAMMMTGVPAVASSDQLMKLKNVEAASTIVGYVGQQKSASWLTIKAGLLSYKPKPRIVVAKQSKKICTIGSDLVRLAKVGNCLLTLTSGRYSKKLVIGVRQLLPRTTVDRPGGNILDIKPLYITFKNGPDNSHDIDGVVAQMMSNSLDYMAEQNPGFTPRLDTYEGLPDIQHIQIPMTYEEFATKWTTTFGPLAEVLGDMGFSMPSPELTGRGYDKINRIYVALVEGSLPLKKGFASGHVTPGCGTNSNSGIVQYWIRMPDGSKCDWIVKSFNRKGLLDKDWTTEVVRHLIERSKMRTNVGCDAKSMSYYGLPLSQMDNSISRQDDPITYKYVGRPQPPWTMDGNRSLYFKIKNGPRAGNICDDLAYSPFWTQLDNGDQSSDVVAGRSFTDQPDDSTAPQVHVLYVLPKDVKSRDFDVKGTFSDLITSTNDWLFAKGGKRLRFDTYKGKLDTTFVRLNETEGQLWMEASDKNKKCGQNPCPTLDTLKSLLDGKGFTAPHKAYLIYYGGATIPSSRIAWQSCGYAGPHAAVMQAGLVDMMSGQFSCFNTSKTTLPESQNTAGLHTFHEIFHVLGGVGASPNSDGNYGHIKNDPTDLMGGSQGTVRLDPGNDDYWRHGKSNFVDLYNSAFMEPAEPNAVMPTGW
jgi:hypothetical protein